MWGHTATRRLSVRSLLTQVTAPALFPFPARSEHLPRVDYHWV